MRISGLVMRSMIGSIFFLCFMAQAEPIVTLEDECTSLKCAPITCMTVSVCLKNEFLSRSISDNRLKREINDTELDIDWGLVRPKVLTLGAIESALDYNLTLVNGRQRIGRSTYQAVVEALAMELGVDYELVLVTPLNREETVSSGKPGTVMDKFAHVGTMLEKGEIDLVLGAFNVLESRLSNVEFSRFFGFHKHTIVMKTPFRAQKADSLIAPFSRDVWFVILASCILMGPLLYLFVAHLEPRAKTVPTTERYSLKNCYWFVYGALLKQGSSLDPSSDVARILFASWWLFIQVITSFYTAELTAVLTLSQSELPVQNMEELRYREGAKWVAIDGAEMAILQKDDSFQYLTQEIAEGKGFLVNSVEEALERVLNDDDTYFLTDKAFAESYVFNDHKARYSADREQARQEGCRLSVAPGFEFGSLPYGLMLRKGNGNLNEKINGIIDQLSLSGILEYLETEKRPLSDLHTVCTLDDDKTLIVQDLISTFLLVILGYAVSTLVLTSELLFPKCLKGRFGTVRPSSNDPCMYPQDEDGLERRMISVNGKKSSVNIIGHK